MGWFADGVPVDVCAIANGLATHIAPSSESAQRLRDNVTMLHLQRTIGEPSLGACM
jgi:hypothetical protein